MSRFVSTVVFVIILTLGHYHNDISSEAKNIEVIKKKKNHKSEVVVVGKVYCDTCFHESSDITTNFISGASVAVECESSGRAVREEARTDERGEFRVRLPIAVGKHVRKIETCQVKLIQSGQPNCAIAASAATSSSVHLRSRRHGTRVFSAGFFSFRPQTQPSVCDQKPITTINDVSQPSEFFPPPLKDPTEPGDLPQLPPLPIPNIPLPDFPNLPPLPHLPHLPRLPNLPPIITRRKTIQNNISPNINNNNDNDGIGAREFFFPPNPLQPPLIPNPLQPPAPLIPNPFQPPPAPVIPNPFQPPPTPVIPNPFQPPPAPPAPLIPLPTVPGLTPTPSPPPPAGFPFPHFPPFPFRPPRIPGVPPAL